MSIGLETRGFSDAARFVEESTDSGRRYLQQSEALSMASIVRDELASVWEQCRHPNWDGFEALPISQDTLRSAYLLLESLPLGFPAPSLGAEPDGALTLEWHHSARRTLSVSIGPEGDLHYAGLFGPNRVYGTEAFFGEVPQSIIGLIRRAA